MIKSKNSDMFMESESHTHTTVCIVQTFLSQIECRNPNPVLKQPNNYDYFSFYDSAAGGDSVSDSV